MKQNQAILILSVMTAITSASCARSEPPVVVEQQAAPLTAAAASERVRESAWRPAPVRSGTPKPTQPTAPAPYAAPAPYIAPAVRNQPMKATLAEGSILAVRVGDTLSSEKNQTGDSWSGVLAEPLLINGLIIADRGAQVEGRVSNLDRAGRVKGVARMSVQLTQFNTADGQRIDVSTASFAVAGKDDTKRDAGKVAIASGVGAAIGAIAGRGKGAAIGAGAGAAAGTGVVLATRGGPAIIPVETLIRFRVAAPVTITEKLR